MKAIKAIITKGLQIGTKIRTTDNSGAQLLKVLAVKGSKTTKGRRSTAGIGDLIIASIVKGKPGLKKQIVQAVVVRQRKEFRRPSGLRVKFEDNAVVVIKDDIGTPKGTIIKGPIAKEVAERWPGIAKVASMFV